MIENGETLPEGCGLVQLRTHSDDRGTVTEMYRDSWIEGTKCQQWNMVRSNTGTLRGVHVHVGREDYLVVVEGEMWLGLYDMRRHSATFGQSSMFRLTPERNCAAYIGTGVAHGFYFTKPSITVYGLTEYFSMDDEVGCHPEDPALGLSWPKGQKILSQRDQGAYTLAELQLEYDRRLTLLNDKSEA